jgi:long-chain fatty acid transport protein
MKTPYRHTRIALAMASVALALGAGQAYGAAFGLAEQSGSGLGNAFAGGAAVAEDAATVWANPAGMTRIPTMQAVAALHLITPSIKLNNDGSVAALNQPLGHNGGDAGTDNVVPNMYLAVPITKQFSFGLGVNAPFGLVTHYGDGWLGRYQGVKSEITTINVNPAFSWAVTDAFSVGVGANYQRIDATLTSALNYSAALLSAAQQAAAAGQIPASLIPSIAAATPGLDATTNLEGDDSAWGWNIGVLYNISDKARVGAHYRSAIQYHVTGNVRFDKPALPTLPPTLAPVVASLANAVNAQLADGGVRIDLEMPQKFNVSYFQTLNDKWDVMADVQWTGWSSIPELKVVRNSGSVLQQIPYNWKDSWRYSVGANYRYDDKLMFRGGLAYDETPVNDTDRGVRLPDTDRIWISIGAQYKFTPNLKFDAGFTYIVGDSGPIVASANATVADVAGTGRVKGSYDASVTIFSGQVTYSF